MRVTTQPIAQPSTSQIGVLLAQGGPATTYPFLPVITVSNTGMGTLQLTGVSTTGTEVNAVYDGSRVVVTADPGSLAPGTYNDSVAISCNAVNCPLQVSVSLEIVPRAPPLIFYRGVVDNATFTPEQAVAPGDVAIAQGEQLSLEAPALAGPAPLPTSLGGARVLVNGVAAPLFYSSFRQIDFQVPSATAAGTALVQVERDGQIGNTVSVTVAQLAPQIVAVTDTAYNLLDTSHPATAGATVILWAIGLGPTSPAVPDGAPAPAAPLAAVTNVPKILFLSGDAAYAPSGFAGLSPGGVGLYQVAITVPAAYPKGVATVELQYPAGISSVFSNLVSFGVQ
jgi:uncharacterized protein (TIGR03437 family)